MSTEPATWTLPPFGALNGLRVIVTGANSGIGLEAARALADRGASVTLACRNLEKASAAREQLLKSASGSVEIGKLDLSDLGSVETFASSILEKESTLDLLINNAGIMGPPLTRTSDGIELQFATNHLGHFALTGRLLPLLSAAKAARVVTVSSNLHKGAVLDLEDLGSHKSYSGQKAYGRSKLANLLFALELDRRLRATSSPVASIGAHPGWSQSNLATNGPIAGKGQLSTILGSVASHLGQKSSNGALPTLYGALGTDVEGGDYVGPSGLMELWGKPHKVEPSTTARDQKLAAALFQKSEELTGVTFP